LKTNGLQAYFNHFIGQKLVILHFFLRSYSLGGQKSLDLFGERLYKLKDAFGSNDFNLIQPELQGTRGALASATGP
jgi:hypothetical protein